MSRYTTTAKDMTLLYQIEIIMSSSLPDFNSPIASNLEVESKCSAPDEVGVVSLVKEAPDVCTYAKGQLCLRQVES